MVFLGARGDRLSLRESTPPGAGNNFNIQFATQRTCLPPPPIGRSVNGKENETK